MHPALEAVRRATLGSEYEGDLYVVGGYVRDELLGTTPGNDADLVTTRDAPSLAESLFAMGLTDHPAVTYPRFGTAMVAIGGMNLEFVTARRESYEADSRKPTVEPATLEEDAARRDFTVNAILKGLHDGRIYDPTGLGLADLTAKVLRTPLEPATTFRDDPLRMLRAIRFRWQLGFEAAPGLYAALESEAARLTVVSAERIKGELVKMLTAQWAADAMADLMQTGLTAVFAPELVAMCGVEQGSYHHLDVWHHTLAAVRNVTPGDPLLTLATLLHDVGKPATRTIDANGQTRFFGHEVIGARIASDLLRCLKFSNDDVDTVARLVKNHMRLGTAPAFSPAAARRLIRDLGDDLPRLLALVEADAGALKAGVRVLDLSQIRSRLAEIQAATPRQTLESPLSGEEIMRELQVDAGPGVGSAKAFLLEQVLEGNLAPNDREHAKKLLKTYSQRSRS
ncbi:MAG: CCA tRNA nucleotidyltransferase [Fimbriimonadaceae bacterium]